MKEKILSMLSEIRPEFDFTASSDYVEDGYLDSFDVVTLVSQLEEEYNCLIDAMDIVPEYFKTVETIEKLVIKNGGEA